MKSLITILLSVCLSGFTFKAGNIDIQVTSTEVKINSILVKPTFTLDDFITIIGKPDRTVKAKRTTYFYDKLGLVLSSVENSLIISKINVFYNDQAETGPEGTYYGLFTIGGYSVSATTPYSTFDKIGNMYLKKDPNTPGRHTGTIGFNAVVITYDSKDTELSDIEITMPQENPARVK